MKKFALLYGLLFVAVTACNDTADTKEPVQPASAIELTSLQLQDLNGAAIDMQQYKGKVVFVNFWATWCKPCVQEMPSIAAAMKELKEKEIEFLFASDESAEQVQAFRSAHDFPFHYVQSKNTGPLNIMALPTTFIFDRNGSLIFNEMGIRNWAGKENIDLLLNLVE